MSFFLADMSGQTVQTQIRLLLEEQSDQGLYCLQFCLHCLDAIENPYQSNFRILTVIFSGVQIFMIFTVNRIMEIGMEPI